MKLSADIPQVLRENANAKFEAFCTAAKDANVSLSDDSEFLERLKRVFTFSDFVSKICIRSPEIVKDLLESGDLQRKLDPDAYDSKLESHLFNIKDDVQLSVLLRRFRRREMVRIAWRDLAGWADLSETMADLSALADACIDQSVSFLYEWQCSENGIPTGDDGSDQHLVVFGMGKLGGRELNFSSDVDLIFTYPETGATRDTSEPMNNEEFFVRLCRRLIKIIGANTSDGFVFRVDTDLRPFGENGPLVMSFDAMEEYYQKQGREWERYAWIKARVVAGDKDAGETLLKNLKPFVFRRYLDFGVFEALRTMKQKYPLKSSAKG